MATCSLEHNYCKVLVLCTENFTVHVILALGHIAACVDVWGTAVISIMLLATSDIHPCLGRLLTSVAYMFLCILMCAGPYHALLFICAVVCSQAFRMTSLKPGARTDVTRSFCVTLQCR